MPVPRRYLLVWMGSRFPYACRLAVESILLADPGAAVELHILGEIPFGDHLAQLRNVSGASIHRIELDQLLGRLPNGAALRALFDKIPSEAASARSNLVRYALLFERGGVYLDFDVLVRRPLTELGDGRPFIGAEQVWMHDQARVEGRWRPAMLPATVAWGAAWGLRRADAALLGGRASVSRLLRPLTPHWSDVQPNNAVIGSPPGSEFIGRVLERALEADPTVRYALGPTLVAKVAAEVPESVCVLPPKTFYCVPPGESFRFFEDRTLTLPTTAALIHYVGSNHRALVAGIVEGDERFAARREVFWRLAGEIERRRPELVGPPERQRTGGPLVSCLMVTRDRAAIARRAVACFAQQTWPDRELVIVDDGDEDYTPMLEPYVRAGHHIRYVRRDHDPAVHLGALRNVAIEAARGAWCIQWDDDEWYHPERIAVQVAAADRSAAVALRWTLVSVDSPTLGELTFRADAGIATPGTILHRPDAGRYPNLARGEDSEFMRSVRRNSGLAVLGTEASHLFVRCFHGANTWDEHHFVRRLYRRPADWPSYAAARWWYGDLRRHPAFDLDPREAASISALRRTIEDLRYGEAAS